MLRPDAALHSRVFGCQFCAPCVQLWAKETGKPRTENEGEDSSPILGSRLRAMPALGEYIVSAAGVVFRTRIPKHVRPKSPSSLRVKSLFTFDLELFWSVRCLNPKGSSRGAMKATLRLRHAMTFEGTENVERLLKVFSVLESDFVLGSRGVSSHRTPGYRGRRHCSHWDWPRPEDSPGQESRGHWPCCRSTVSPE